MLFRGFLQIAYPGTCLSCFEQVKHSCQEVFLGTRCQSRRDEHLACFRLQTPDRQQLQNDMTGRNSFTRSSWAHIMAIMAAALQQADLSLVSARILEQKVLFLKDCVGSEVEAGMQFCMILHDSTKFILNLHEFACCIGYAFMARASRDQSGFQAACADPEPGSVILLENLSWRLKTQEQHIDFAIQHTIACRGILVRLFLEVILNSQSLCTRISHWGGRQEWGKRKSQGPQTLQTKMGAVYIGIHFSHYSAFPAEADPEKVKDFRASLVRQDCTFAKFQWAWQVSRYFSLLLGEAGRCLCQWRLWHGSQGSHLRSWIESLNAKWHSLGLTERLLFLHMKSLLKDLYTVLVVVFTSSLLPTKLLFCWSCLWLYSHHGQG